MIKPKKRKDIPQKSSICWGNKNIQISCLHIWYEWYLTLVYLLGRAYQWVELVLKTSKNVCLFACLHIKKKKNQHPHIVWHWHTTFKTNFLHLIITLSLLRVRFIVRPDLLSLTLSLLSFFEFTVSLSSSVLKNLSGIYLCVSLGEYFLSNPP